MKSVLKHLNKNEVNLASDKVELGAIDDLKSDLKKSKDLIDFVTDMNSFLDRAKTVAKNGSVTADSYIDRIKERASKVESQLKELGLEKSAVKEFKDVDKTITFLNSIKKDFDRVMKINS